MSRDRLIVAVVIAAVLLAGAGAIGWAIGQEGEAQESVTSPAPPAGHVGGPNLDPATIGDQARGQRLFSQKGCATCHSYAGRGGDDAPPLDDMRGHLSATEIALMSGAIWNHTPAMLEHFEEEGMPFPGVLGHPWCFREAQFSQREHGPV